VIETSTPNAFAAGMSPEHAVVAVTRGALRLLDRRELEGVLAHELSHIGNRDIRLNTIAASVTLFLRIPYLTFRRKLSGRSSGFSLLRRSLNLTDLAMSPLALYILVVAPVLGTLVGRLSRGTRVSGRCRCRFVDPFSRGLDARAGQDRRRGSGQPNSNPAFSHSISPIRPWPRAGSATACWPPIRSWKTASSGCWLSGRRAMPALEAAVQEGRSYTSARVAMELVDYAPA